VKTDCEKDKLMESIDQLMVQLKEGALSLAAVVGEPLPDGERRAESRPSHPRISRRSSRRATARGIRRKVIGVGLGASSSAQ